MFPEHKEQTQRLNRIQGQVGGIVTMIEGQRYCIDILTQIKAIQQALRKVELGVLERHLQHCLKEAVESKDSSQVQVKMDEIMKLLATQK